MTVRRATISDIPHLLEMARREHAKSRMAHIPFNDKKTLVSLGELVDGVMSAVFVSDKGFIIGVIQPMLFNLFWNAYELAWYAEDGEGMSLLKELESWAKGMRALDLVIHNYAGMTQEQTFTKVVGRLGFSQIGHSYTKKLGDI